MGDQNGRTLTVFDSSSDLEIEEDVELNVLVGIHEASDNDDAEDAGSDKGSTFDSDSDEEEGGEESISNDGMQI
jgi:hypothetical protein